jgi:hypothetical protein
LQRSSRATDLKVVAAMLKNDLMKKVHDRLYGVWENSDHDGRILSFPIEEDTNYCTIHHGVAACVLQLPLALKDDPVMVDPAGSLVQPSSRMRKKTHVSHKRDSSSTIFMQPSSRVRKIHVFGKDGSDERIPTFCFSGMVRNLAGGHHCSPLEYQDGQAGGYSILVCSVWKALAVGFVQPPELVLGDKVDAYTLEGCRVKKEFEDEKEYEGSVADVWVSNERLDEKEEKKTRGTGKPSIMFRINYDDGDFEDVDYTHLQAILASEASHGNVPFQQCYIHPLNLWSVLQPYELDLYATPPSVNNKEVVVKAFEDGVFPRSSCALQFTGIVNGARQVFFVRDSWESFGCGTPMDAMHSIPSKPHAADADDSPLPGLRIFLVRDLLHRCGMITSKKDGPFVGGYVLYAGKSVLAGRSAGTRWLHGVIVSMHDDVGGGTPMCEVLYWNGWVLWHLASSFSLEGRFNRRSNLKFFPTATQMLVALTGYSRAEANFPDVLCHWMRQTGWDYAYTSLYESRKSNGNYLLEQFAAAFAQSHEIGASE